VSKLARLESVVERQSEQVDRLEDLAREIVLSVESLRREIGRGDAAAVQPRDERAGTSREGGPGR
jgi:hypothetical protein